jgi:hypothetical protein
MGIGFFMDMKVSSGNTKTPESVRSLTGCGYRVQNGISE